MGAKRAWGAASSLLSLLLLAASSGCGAGAASPQGKSPQQKTNADGARVENSVGRPVSSGSPFLDKLVEAAIERTTQKVRYDPAYVVIPYPGGDVPAETGVCSDEVIRSYRKLGVDLQKEVHEDMARNFRLYPKKWGLMRPDTNIDHRRVPNLMLFFERQGASLPVTSRARDYRPGDIVTWDLGGGLTHIGIVVNVASESDAERFKIVHNIGAGPQMEDVLFNWKITGHYRYFGPATRAHE
ncbi:MAG TPA: DUF1287 domain-containing protein [Pyrinomonadaceae bacterium]|nr:DUF1287 domain-containing protein [Pyrinomonadaceae bacterium]